MRSALIAAVALAACRDAEQHAFQAPPPTPVKAPVVSTVTLEMPFGSRGPDAKITAIETAETGTPALLNDLAESIRVTTLVARGPGAWTPDRHARIELAFSGAQRVVFARPLETPAPLIVAHAFVVPISPGEPDALKPGNYQMQVRLVMRDSAAFAASAPVAVRVRQR